MEESKASPAPAPLNRRRSFLSGSAASQRPQSHSESQFPAGTWRWARSGGLHQAAGIRGEGSPAETKASLGPSHLGQGGQVQGWRQLLGRGLQETCLASPQHTALGHSSVQIASRALGAGPGDTEVAGKAHLPLQGWTAHAIPQATQGQSARAEAESSPIKGLNLPGWPQRQCFSLNSLILRQDKKKAKLCVSFRPCSSSRGTPSKGCVSVTLKPCT